MGDAITIARLEHCARCTQTHENLTFQPLTRGADGYSHWVPCPTNGEPLLMRVMVSG